MPRQSCGITYLACSTLREALAEVDGIHERTAGKAEETAEHVPGHVVAVGRENSAVSDDGEDHELEEGEETYVYISEYRSKKKKKKGGGGVLEGSLWEPK
jgi:co-chaperonin GroES (HSP10)